MSLISRIKNLVNICRVTAFQNGNWKVTLLDDETISNVPYAQPFGFKTQPPVNSKGVLLSRGGQKSGGFLIVLEDDSGAPDLSEGEVSIFNDHGTVIHLKSNGDVEIKGGNVKILSGDLQASGDVSDTNATTPTMLDMRTLFNAHIHNVSGAVTGPPTTQQ